MSLQTLFDAILAELLLSTSVFGVWTPVRHWDFSGSAQNIPLGMGRHTHKEAHPRSVVSLHHPTLPDLNVPF